MASGRWVWEKEGTAGFDGGVTGGCEVREGRGGWAECVGWQGVMSRDVVEAVD